MPTLDFKGKQLVYAHHLTVAARPLEVDAEKSLPPDGETPSLNDNLIIHGDNLHALKALFSHYAGRIDCIYIDPPYNTGNEGWIYNDNMNSPLMQEWLQGKSPVDGEDLAHHDKWLCMMWPRLQLLKELLAEDGVIFVSIDDNEQHRLRMMMDEIFGEGNCVNSLVWVNNMKGRQIGNHGAAKTHETILAYAKDIESVNAWHISVRESRKMPSAYNIQDREVLKDEHGHFVIKNELHNTNNAFNEETRRNLVFVIHYNPKTKQIKFSEVTEQKTHPGFVQIRPRANSNGKQKYLAWRWSQKKILAETHNLHFVQCDDPHRPYRVYTKVRHLDVTLFKDLITNISSGGGTLKKLGLDFPNSKPMEMIKLLIGVATKPDSIILDSFAGSGTTAHAVLALNREDGGNRRFILVECEDTIADNITAERVRRVIAGVPSAPDEVLKKGLGGSFTYCALGNEISIETMLAGDGLPNYETLARHIYWTATGRSLDSIRGDRGPDGLFYEDKDRIYYLIYEPNLNFLRSNESALNSERAERIAKQVQAKQKGAIAFASHKFMGQKELTTMGIVFCGLPYGV